MHRLFGSIVALSGMALFACGGSSNGSGAVTGDPFSFQAKSALLLLGGSPGAPDLKNAIILLEDREWTCDQLKQDPTNTSVHYARLTFSNAGQDVTTGQYPVTRQIGILQVPNSTVEVYRKDGTGQFAGGFAAAQGSLSVTSFSASRATGTFQATDGTYTVSGNFDAPFCDELIR